MGILKGLAVYTADTVKESNRVYAEQTRAKGATSVEINVDAETKPDEPNKKKEKKKGRKSTIVLCILLLLSVVSCSSAEDSGYESGYKEGYNVGYDKGLSDANQQND